MVCNHIDRIQKIGNSTKQRRLRLKCKTVRRSIPVGVSQPRYLAVDHAAHTPWLWIHQPTHTAESPEVRLQAQPRIGAFLMAQPGLFLSQSSSIFNLPISPYRCSGSLYSFTALGPRLPSNRLPARSRISFFHCPTCTGCTPCSCASWLRVFTAWIASKPTLALNSAPNTFRFVPLISRFLLTSDNSLNYCLKFGVHYNPIHAPDAN